MDLKIKQLISKNQDKGLLLSDQAVVSGTNFMLGILLTRILGLDIFGLFSTVWIILLFWSSIQQAVIISPMLTFGARITHEEQKNYLGSLFYIQLFSGLIIAAITFLIWPVTQVIFPDMELSAFRIPVVFLVFAFLMHEFFRKSLITKIQYKKLLTLDLIGYGSLIPVLLISYSFYGLNLKNTFGFLTLGFMISSFVGYSFLPKTKFRSTKFQSVLKQNFQFGKWLLATSVLQWFSGNMFIVVAGSLWGAAAMGIIRIAQSLVGLLGVFFQFLENRIPVQAAQIYKSGGWNSLVHYIKMNSLKSIFVSVIFGVGLVLFSGAILRVVYGIQGEEHRSMIAGFGLLNVLIVVGLFLRFMIRTIEINRHIFISYVMGTLFTFLSVHPMLHYFGIHGVVVGLLINQIIMSSWFLIVLIKKSKVQYENHTSSIG